MEQWSALVRYFSGHQSLRRAFSEILGRGTKEEALRRFVICHLLLAIYWLSAIGYW